MLQILFCQCFEVFSWEFVCVGCVHLQLFIHRVFGYRGVILFPWVGKVYDRDISTKEEKYAVNFLP